MKKRTIMILTGVILVISIVVSIRTIKQNYEYDLEDYLARICNKNNEEMKCVYTYAEYNPFTYKHTFYYQVTKESYKDKMEIIQQGVKNSIEEVLDVANSHNANSWIELGEDYLLVVDENNYTQLKKGVTITKDELIYIVNDLDSN